MEYKELPYGFTHGWGNKGIIVRPDELYIFANYLMYHNVRHGYEDFTSIIRRIQKKGDNVVFWYDGRRLHYFSVFSIPPRNMYNTNFCTLYEEAIDVPDILDLL